MRKPFLFALVAALVAIALMSSPAWSLVPAEQLSSAQRRNHIALLKAIMACDPVATKNALEAGADPNLNVDDRLPLEAAILIGDIEIVRALLDAGADPKLKDAKGKTMIELAYSYGSQPGDLSKAIGDLLQARSEGKAEPNPAKVAEEEKPQVILMPEQAVRCEPIAQPDLSAYGNPKVPEGWTALTTKQGKIVILTNGKSGEDAGRVIFLEPEHRSSDDLDDVMDWTEQNLRSLAKMVGAKNPDEVEVEITLRRVLPVKADAKAGEPAGEKSGEKPGEKHGEKKPVRIVAEFTIWDYPYIVANVEMTGVIDTQGEFKGIVNFRGKTEEAQKSYRAYLDAVQGAFKGDD